MTHNYSTWIKSAKTLHVSIIPNSTGLVTNYGVVWVLAIQKTHVNYRARENRLFVCVYMCVPGARRFVRPTPFQLLAIVVVKLRHVCTTKPQQIRTDRTSRGLFRNKRIGKLALALTTLCSFSLAHSLTHMHARTHTLPCYGSQSQK